MRGAGATLQAAGRRGAAAGGRHGVALQVAMRVSAECSELLQELADSIQREQEAVAAAATAAAAAAAAASDADAAAAEIGRHAIAARRRAALAAVVGGGRSIVAGTR
jgi:hypothetical protein